MSMSTASSVIPLITVMDDGQLQEPQTKVQAEIVKRTYGKWFTDIVGVERICQLPLMDANGLKETGLDEPGKYPQGKVKVSTIFQLFKATAFRYMDGLDRPGIGIIIKATDLLTGETRQVVELIFKRYSNKLDGKEGAMHANNYVTALGNATEENDPSPLRSFLYDTGFMNRAQVEAVRDLLDGKEISSPNHLDYSLKRA